MLIHTDGACAPNPGHGVAAVVAYDLGKECARRVKYLGPAATNNSAEHHALLMALELARDSAATGACIESDSLLAVTHFNGDEAAVQSNSLRPLVARSQSVALALPGVTVRWVPRHLVADAHDVAHEELAKWRHKHVDRPVTPTDRVVGDVLADLQARGVGASTERHAVVTDYSAIIPLAYYEEQGLGFVTPSVDSSIWSELGDVLVAWRPYGSQGTPRPATDVLLDSPEGLVNARDGGCELLYARATSLSLGEATGRVGYSGAKLHVVAGGPWRPSRSFELSD